MADKDAFATTLSRLIEKSLLSDDINNIQVTISNIPTYKYDVLKKFGLNDKQLAKNSVLINKPLNFFSKYLLHIIIFFCAILVIVLLIWAYGQKGKNASIRKYRNILKDMPMPFLIMKAIKDKEGDE